MKSLILNIGVALTLATTNIAAPPAIDHAKLPDDTKAQQIKDMQWGMFICWSFTASNLLFE